jgi:hypothetical protein
MLSEQADLRRAHSGVGAALDGSEEGIDPSGMGDGVVIEDCQEGGGGFAPASIDGGSEAYIAGAFEDARAGSSALTDEAFAAVIDDYHFKIAPRLLVEGLHAFQKPRIRSQCGDYHGYQNIGQLFILAN